MRRVGVILAGLVVAAACSSGTVDDVAADPTPTAELTEPTAPPDPTPTPEPTAIPEPTSNEDVQVAWENFVEGAFGPAGDQDHLALALEYGTQAALDRLAIFQGSFDRQVNQHYTNVEPTDTGFVINDCFSTTPPIGRPAWLWFSAVVVDTDTGPLIESVQGEQIEVDCVPAQIATEVIAGYEAQLDAETVFWSPADPDHPLVEATMTGSFLEFIRDLLAQDADNGRVSRGRPVTHPYISALTSSGQYILTDCQEPSQDKGVYIAATGERLDDLIAPIQEGQRDLDSMLMELDAGTWKVAERRGDSNVDCSFEPGSDALPVVS